MTVHPPRSAFSLDAYLEAHERKSLLRFITCGSVDDGKSTLIGRLLYESKRLFDDQLATLERDSRRHGTQGGAIDFALLVDGLASEREQGITIDVAYRFFSTARRTFIVADTPGHEQYTRNMATGASTADVAVLLVDARKGLSRQTRRHALLVSMLGIRHVVLAVNKMDLVGWSQERFDEIVADFTAFAGALAFAGVQAIPLSALGGDNVVEPSAAAPWHRGPTLLGHLEAVEPGGPAGAEAFRMTVQWVNRPNAEFRGFAGQVAAGVVRVGDAIRVLPSGVATRVSGIVTYDGPLDEAVAGQSVTVTLADEVDVSRGDVLAGADAPAQVASRLEARLFWMAGESLKAGDAYLVKIGAQTVPATVEAVRRRVDLQSLEARPATMLEANDIGEVTLALDRPVAFDAYRTSRQTGGFILIDRETYDTAGMGLVEEPAAAAERPSPGRWLRAPRERPWRSLAKAVSWRATGTLGTVALAWIVTRDAGLAALIGAAEVGAKLALYYGHERIWARVGLGWSGREAVRE